MNRFRHKPTIIMAQQWHAYGEVLPGMRYINRLGHYVIRIDAKDVEVRSGDWIAKDAYGLRYHFPPGLFAELYESVDESVDDSDLEPKATENRPTLLSLGPSGGPYLGDLIMFTDEVRSGDGKLQLLFERGQTATITNLNPLSARPRGFETVIPENVHFKVIKPGPRSLNGWIDVENLPLDEELVILGTLDCVPGIARSVNGEWTDISCDPAWIEFVTQWHPLPVAHEPPALQPVSADVMALAEALHDAFEQATVSSGQGLEMIPWLAATDLERASLISVAYARLNQ